LAQKLRSLRFNFLIKKPKEKVKQKSKKK